MPAHGGSARKTPCVPDLNNLSVSLLIAVR
jgi:hypothetical protein